MAELSRSLCLSHSFSAVGQIMECERRSHLSANASARAEGYGIRQIPQQIRPKKTRHPRRNILHTCPLVVSLLDGVTSAHSPISCVPCGKKDLGRGGGGAGGEDARGNAEAQIKP